MFLKDKAEVLSLKKCQITFFILNNAFCTVSLKYEHYFFIKNKNPDTSLAWDLILLCRIKILNEKNRCHFKLKIMFKKKLLPASILTQSPLCLFHTHTHTYIVDTN